MSKNLKTQWRVQVRKSRAHKWVNRRGLFETRSDAREKASELRDPYSYWGYAFSYRGYGFGNTRVVKYVRAGK